VPEDKLAIEKARGLREAGTSMETQLC